MKQTIMKKMSSKRLDSIRAAHESEKLESSTRMEDYLEVIAELVDMKGYATTCLLYTSPSPRDQRGSRMPSSA